jgi:hypothetical protein
MASSEKVFREMVENYLGEADGWSSRQISKGVSDWYFENNNLIDDIDDFELMRIAEDAYNGPRDWPQASSIRDGILQLASDSLSGEFAMHVSSAVSDFEDFDSLYCRHPYRGVEPDSVYDEDVSVFWDKGDEEFVAIKTVVYGQSKFYLNVSSNYDFEDDVLLQLKRSAHEGQEDDGGGEAEAR